MSYYTQADLVTKILDKLGVVPTGNTPQLEDVNRIIDLLPAIVESVAGREILYIPDINNIEGKYFLPFASIAAWECTEEFGTTGDDLSKLQQDNANAILELRVMTRGRPTYEILRTQNF
jgi:hypothetical protein